MRLLLLACATLLSLYSCRETSPAPSAQSADSTPVTIASSADADPGCPRGVPTPALKAGSFPGSNFKLFPDSVSALETARLPNGDTFQIYHHGCEYVIYTFRTTIIDDTHDTTDTPHWLRTSARLVEAIWPGLDIPLPLNAGIIALDNLATSGITHISPAFEVNIDSAGDMRFYYTLDHVSNKGNGTLLEFSFVYGPL